MFNSKNDKLNKILSDIEDLEKDISKISVRKKGTLDKYEKHWNYELTRGAYQQLFDEQLMINKITAQQIQGQYHQQYNYQHAEILKHTDQSMIGKKVIILDRKEFVKTYTGNQSFEYKCAFEGSLGEPILKQIMYFLNDEIKLL